MIPPRASCYGPGMGRTRVFLWLLLTSLSPLGLWAASSLPAPLGNVSDFAALLDPSQASTLEDVIQELRESDVWLAVATIPAAGDRTPKEWATDAFQEWKIGEKGKDNGVLIVLSLGDRRVEVETGYGVEARLPDFRVGQLLDAYAVPSFRQNRWGEGLLGLARGIRNHLQRNPQDPGSRPAPLGSPESSSASLGILAAGVFALGAFLGKTGVLPFYLAGFYLIWACSFPLRHRFIVPKVFGLVTFLVLAVLVPFVLAQGTFFLESPELIMVGLGIFAGLYTLTRSCPRCSQGYISVTTRTLRSATYSRKGRGERTVDCPKCRYHKVSTYVIPRRTRTQSRSRSSSGSSWSSSSSSSSWSSSSRSSSFGGGSSGGGGAGRSF